MKIIRSAFKHGVRVEDIVYVVETAYNVILLREDPTKWLYLGFSSSGVPLEVISVINDDGQEIIIHAMKQTRFNQQRKQKS